MNVKLYDSLIKKEKSSDEGQLVFLDDADLFIGRVKRIYTIFNVKNGIIRGHHAHKSLQQLIFCMHGKVKLSLNDANGRTEVILDRPSKFLYVGPMIWRTIEWLQNDSVLVVLASENYDESDYIRSYDEFLRLVDVEKNSI